METIPFAKESANAIWLAKAFAISIRLAKPFANFNTVCSSVLNKTFLYLHDFDPNYAQLITVE